MVRLSDDSSNNVFDLLLMTDYPYVGLYTTLCVQTVCDIQGKFDYEASLEATLLNVDLNFSSIIMPNNASFFDQSGSGSFYSDNFQLKIDQKIGLADRETNLQLDFLGINSV